MRKRSFNLNKFNKRAFAAEEIEDISRVNPAPAIEPDRDTETEQEDDPYEWEHEYEPGKKPSINPDPQNYTKLTTAAGPATLPPRTLPDAPPEETESPDEWEHEYEPGPRPKITPDPQNRSDSPGPATLPPRTLPDAPPEETESPDEWEHEYEPGRKPKIIPDPQNSWFKRAQGRDFHQGTNMWVKSLWSQIQAGTHRAPNAILKHDFIKRHGPVLAREGSHHALEAVQQHGIQNLHRGPEPVGRLVYELFSQVANYERANKERLESLACAIAAKKLGLPKGMFKATLMTLGAPLPQNPHKEEFEETEEPEELKVELNDAVAGQLPMQFLAQGAGLNTMMQFDQIAMGLLDEVRVPPEIIQKYRKLSQLLSAMHFSVDGFSIITGEGGGRPQDLASNEMEDEAWENGEYKVHAKAYTFPLLVYECISGAIRIESLKNLDHNEVAVKDPQFINSHTGARSVEALGFHAGSAFEMKFKEFCDFVEKKYPNVDYIKVLHTLFLTDPITRVQFSNHLMRNEFEEAAKAIKPKRR